jgi:glycine/D-amino acid oxidase-like deaminating enzyme
MAANTFAPIVRVSDSLRRVSTLPKNARIAVVGAGAFGVWSALHLLRAGFKVTLIDAWGPGNSRSSSGDETRVIRSTYGANEFYFDLNARSVELFQNLSESVGRPLFVNSGALWFCYQEKTPVVDDSIPFARRHHKEYVYLTPAELGKRFPQTYKEDLHHAYFDPFAGYALARECCAAVLERFTIEGGDYIQAWVQPGTIRQSTLQGLLLSNGQSITADMYLFASGSWLGQLFPDVLSQLITCTRQEVYYFGVPREVAHDFDSMPVWVDVDGKNFYYGIPGNARRGFKLGVDIRGPAFNPTTDERTPDPLILEAARKFIDHRFPELKNAPLVESRVCPYENSPDGNFVFDHHPEASNCWFLGGGSGHGFKHGPALGELVANIFKEGSAIPSLFHSVTRN